MFARALSLQALYRLFISGLMPETFLQICAFFYPGVGEEMGARYKLECAARMVSNSCRIVAHIRSDVEKKGSILIYRASSYSLAILLSWRLTGAGLMPW